GVNVRPAALFEDRAIHDFDLAAVPSFIANPCGSRSSTKTIENLTKILPVAEETAIEGPPQNDDPLAVVLSAVVDETGLAVSQISVDDRFLDGLHLNSLAVTRIVTTAAKAMNVRTPSAPTEFSNATPRLLADALAEVRKFSRHLPIDTQRIA